MAEWKKPLESMIGKKGVETLSKAIHRRDSDSTIGPLDVYLPLLVVPRTILSWLVHNIKPIAVGDTEKFQFPGMKDVEISVEKQGADSYRGEFIKDGKVIHSFDKQTLPNVGGNLMSVGEIYDDYAIDTEAVQEEVDDIKQCINDLREQEQAEQETSPDIAMPHAMMQMMAPQIDQSRIKEMDATTMANLTYSLGRLIDALVSNNLTEQRLSTAISTVRDDLEKDDEPDVAAEAADIIDGKNDPHNGRSTKQVAEDRAKKYAELEVRTIKRFFDAGKKAKINKTAIAEEGPSGQARPSRPDGIVEPTKPSRKPVSNKSYFRQRLDRSKGMEKKEVEKTYHVHEHQLYTTCPHCEVPEFEKTESGPKYKPCACFYVTLKDEEGRAKSFVHVIKKSEGGYSLVFNKDADTDTIQTFLSTLKNKLMAYKDSLS